MLGGLWWADVSVQNIFFTGSKKIKEGDFCRFSRRLPNSLQGYILITFTLRAQGACRATYAGSLYGRQWSSGP